MSTADNDRVPPISPAIIEYLERIFPMKDYDKYEDQSDIRFYSGCRHVVNFVRSQFEQQNETIIDKE
jgi:hypothetical protein